jgi:beta-lactamase regulating signal transducer with metallopeptidase domain
MSTLAALADGSVSRALALTLVHFLWQGAVIALLLRGALAALGNASSRARYGVACAALALIALLPAATFSRLREVPARPQIGSVSAAGSLAAAAAAPDALTPSKATGDFMAAAAPWIVLGWLSGVLAFSIRFIGGGIAARRLSHEGTKRLGAAWEARLTELSRRLEIRRAIRLLESTLVRVPTALGLLRPVILLPAGISTGLSASQLDSLLAHELAHIRRGDYLVNLLQVLVETLLFYNPAVWWISGRVRAERENACDDLAVAATGDAVAYARALLELAERRRAVLALALNAGGGPLWERISRLVAPPQTVSSGPPRWLAGTLILSSVLALGAVTRVPSVEPEGQSEPPPATAAATAPQIEPSPASPPAKAQTAPPSRPAPRGLLSPENLIAFRIHGVTPEFVGDIAGLGYTKASPDQLVALRVHGVTSDYIREMTAIFGKLPLDRFVEFRIHGLTPGSLRDIEALFGKVSADDALSMRIHGVDAAYVSGFRDAGYGTISADEAVSLRIHGVTPEFARAMRAQGFTSLTVDDLIAFRIHGVAPEYVAAIRALGYSSLSPDDVTALRIHGLSVESIRAINQRAGELLSPDELVEQSQYPRRRARDKENES